MDSCGLLLHGQAVTKRLHLDPKSDLFAEVWKAMLEWEARFRVRQQLWEAVTLAPQLVQPLQTAHANQVVIQWRCLNVVLVRCVGLCCLHQKPGFSKPTHGSEGTRYVHSTLVHVAPAEKGDVPALIACA